MMKRGLGGPTSAWVPHMTRRFALSLAFFLWLAGSLGDPADAAHITVSYIKPGAALVNVRGRLDFTDALHFRHETAALLHAVVLFHSPGGHAAAGILIGRAIRHKRFSTVVPATAYCVSACALAWLGGAPRLMAEGARIGFHTAYALHGGRAMRHGAANAHVARYLRQLGLPSRAIAQIIRPEPHGMYWLTRRTARDIGITVGLSAGRHAG